MELPTFLYGSYREAKKNSRKAVNRLRKGETILDVGQPAIDSLSVPQSYILIDGPHPRMSQGPHFHAFAFADALLDAWTDESDNDFLLSIILQMVELDWCLVCFVSQIMQTIDKMVPHTKYVIMKAMANRWDALSSVGNRYSTGLPHGDPLWKNARTARNFFVSEGLERSLDNVTSADLQKIVDRMAKQQS